MTTPWWLLVWVVLILASGLYLAMRVRALWGDLAALGREVAVAQRRVDGLHGELQLLGDQIREPGDLAVFIPPAQIRRERAIARRTLGRRKRALTPSTGPAWARDVH